MAHIQVFQDKRKHFRWRIVAANNRIIATGGEGYHNLRDMWSAIKQVSLALGASDEETIVHPVKPRLPPVNPAVRSDDDGAIGRMTGKD